MKKPGTWFAPAERATEEQLREEVALVAGNPLFTGLLRAAGGLFAVLNEQRQVLAVNDALLAHLGIEDPSTALGLRPGEALSCAHADDELGGCGTGRLCRSCGAAIAIVTSLESEEPIERDCAMTVRRPDAKHEHEAFFSVRAACTSIGEQKFVLLFLRDATREHHHAAMERIFMHDVGNIVQGIVGAAMELADRLPEGETELAEAVLAQAERLADELSLHRMLVTVEEGSYQPRSRKIDAAQVARSLRVILAYHPEAGGVEIELDIPDEDWEMRTDETALLRVLGNMLTNAMEAESAGAHIRLSLRREGRAVRFEVWNPAAIPEIVQDRIFQRHFSTKFGSGRGLGTYSMKLFGERVLGGKVGFRSSDEDGTTFWLLLPPPPW